jgi:dephospho-CoA kinase
MPPDRPLIVAVTGGIAAGKSALTHRFEQHGAPVIDADLVARELVQPGKPALTEITQHFGADVLAPNGSLDRAALRARVFADPDQRRALEAFLHPRVRLALQERALQTDAPYVLLAIPLLVESGRYDWVDRVLLVDAPVELQITRVMARDRIDRHAAGQMLAAQASRTERLALADDVVVNDGPPAMLDAAVARLDVLYRQLAQTTARSQN